jgi:hypothetical protein
MALALAYACGKVMDEAILDVVELVDVLHNCLTLILYRMLDKSISADGNSQANLAVNHKGLSDILLSIFLIDRRDNLDENLGLRLLRAVEIEGEASVFLEYFKSESTSRASGSLDAEIPQIP